MTVIDPPRRAEPPLGPRKPQERVEPATDRALWPTFMRRTLAEEDLRLPPRTLEHRPEAR